MGTPIFLGYQSSLEFLCRERYFEASPLGSSDFFLGQPPDPPGRRTARVSALPTSVPTSNQIDGLLDGPLRGMSQPLHFLVANRSACHATNRKIAHFWSTTPIRGSFVQIDEDVFVCSPELTFVQIARVLDTVELARLALELCGTYALAPHPDDPFRKHRPATSVEHLRAFADRARIAGIRGTARAQAALSLARNGSASPTETVVALLLCCPYRFGGYGLPFPELNRPPGRERGPQSLVDENPHRCDLLWRDHGVALEYDGAAWHPDGSDGPPSKDVARDNSLAGKRMHVFKVSKGQLYNVEEFDRIVCRLTTVLGKRIRTEQCDYNWALRRLDLRDKLLPSPGNRSCDERAGRTGASRTSRPRRSREPAPRAAG